MGSNAWWCITVITTANDKPCGVTARLLTGATTWPYRTSSYRQYGVIMFWNNPRKGGTLCPLFPVSQRLSHRKLTSHTAQLCYPYSLIATQKAKCPALVQKWWEESVGMWLVGLGQSNHKGLQLSHSQWQLKQSKMPRVPEKLKPRKSEKTHKLSLI